MRELALKILQEETNGYCSESRLRERVIDAMIRFKETDEAERSKQLDQLNELKKEKASQEDHLDQLKKQEPINKVQVNLQKLVIKKMERKIEEKEQLICPHQTSRTPAEEKAGKCRLCGRNIK